MPSDLTLSLIVFIPLVGAALISALPVRTELHRFRVRTTALFATVIPLAIALFDFLGQVSSPGAGSIPEPSIDAPWLRGAFFQLDYHLGTDGLNLLLLLAVTALFPALVLASWRRRERYRTYFALLLLVEVGLSGTFASQDLGLFILFFAWPIVPLALLIAQDGGRARVASGVRLLVVQGLGVAALVAGTMLLLLGTGNTTLDFATLTTVKSASGSTGLVVEVLFLIAFLARMGAFPLQRWFTDAVSESATPVSMLVAASALPVGGYGLVRVALAMEPNGALQVTVPLLALALVTLFWGALRARAEQHLRRLAANCLVALGGLLLLGVASFTETSLGGVIYLCFAYLFTAPLLLLAVGAVCDRAGMAQLGPLSGSAAAAPRLRFCFALAVAGLLGVPLLAGFPGLFQVVLSGLDTHRFFTVAALAGILLLTSAFWRMGQRVFANDADNPELTTVGDSHGSEFYSAWVLGTGIVLFGIFAGYFVPYAVQGTSLVSARISAVAPANTAASKS